MPDLQTDQHLANQMIENAVENCARRLFDGDTQEVYHSLQQGRCDVCGQLSLQLVSQVGKYLGELDHTVKAVYQLAPESQVGVQPHGDQVDENYHPGLNLIVWVERKNPALVALGGTLENALTDSRRKIGCSPASLFHLQPSNCG
jgi:hypothetical protein